MIADTQIDTTIEGLQYDPSITPLNDGGFVLSWTSSLLIDTAVYARRFDTNGMAQGSEFRVNTYMDGYQRDSAISALSDGGFVVSWVSDAQDGSSDGIYAQRFNPKGVAQGSEFRVNTYTIDHQNNPAITALNNGSFVVSWASDNQDGSGAGIYAQRFNANGVAQGSEFRVNTYTDSSQWQPAITALNDGGFVVSWASDNQDGDDSGAYAQRYNANGVAQGSEFRVNTYTIDYQKYPAITALADGGFVVSWTSDNQDGDGYEIYAQRYDENGVAQGSEFRVNTYTAGNYPFIGWGPAPAITALNDDGFVVSWISAAQDGSGYGVYARYFDSNSVAQKSEFLVNTHSGMLLGKLPAIAALKDGGFVVSWESYGGQVSGDASGIFAHRYNAAGNEIGWTAADRLFNWAESIFPDLFPDHPESIELFDYHVRVYESGNALGEQNDNIYFYDSDSISIIFVGTVNDFLPDAIAAGF